MPPTRRHISRRSAAAVRRRDPPARRRRDALWAVAIGLPIGLVACGSLVWQASYSAFTARTGSESNAWTTGTVILTDDDTDAAMFSASNLAPGASASRCLQVRNAGTLPSLVRMYASYTGDADFAAALTITVDVVASGTYADCGGDPAVLSTPFDGTLATFATSHSDWATGTDQWTAPPDATRSYRVTYRLSPDAPSSIQGTTLDATFAWQAQST